MKKRSSYIIALVIGLIFLGLGIIFSSNSDLAELASTTINRYYLFFVSYTTSLFPFSLFEILFIICLIALIIIIIFLLIYIFKKQGKKFLRLLLNTVLILFIIVGLYAFITSPVYNRKPTDLPSYEENLSEEEIEEIARFYLTDYASLAARISRDEEGLVKMADYFDFEGLARKMQEEYSRLYSSYYSSYTPLLKPLINSWLLTEMNTTGITFSLTGEANVNVSIPAIDIPFTCAHELAHTKGVMREDDANLLALYICLTSDNDFIRYSGYFRAYSRILSAVYYSCSIDTYREIALLLPDIVKQEISAYHQYFEAHNTLNKIQDWYNNLYLKINGVKTGIDSYNDKENATDSGDVREDGSIIYNVEFSSYQKLLFALYYES